MPKVFPKKIEYEKVPGGNDVYHIKGGIELRDLLVCSIINGLMARNGVVKTNLNNPERIWALADKILEGR